MLLRIQHWRVLWSGLRRLESRDLSFDLHCWYSDLSEVLYLFMGIVNLASRFVTSPSAPLWAWEVKSSHHLILFMYFFMLWNTQECLNLLYIWQELCVWINCKYNRILKIEEYGTLTIFHSFRKWINVEHSIEQMTWERLKHLPTIPCLVVLLFGIFELNVGIAPNGV